MITPRQANQRLRLDVQVEKANELIILLTENFFRSYWGRQKEFTAVVRLKEMQQVRTVILRAEDFTTADEERVSSWDHADLLSFRAYVEKDGRVLGSKHWNGKQPVLNGLGWVGENE